MSTNASVSASSLEIARALLDRETARSVETAWALPGGALQRACSRVSENLCDSMGEGGCTALLTRALALVEAEHPLLKDVHRSHEGGIQLDRVAAATEIHGLAAVTTAVEALLAALVEVLSRLIGEDMTKTLLDWDADWPDTVSGAGVP